MRKAGERQRGRTAEYCVDGEEVGADWDDDHGKGECQELVDDISAMGGHILQVSLVMIPFLRMARE